MELSTARRLAELNRRFYAEHAEDFADARPRLPDGVRRVLGAIPSGQRVLEVGCGDGKVGRALARGGAAEYVGLDLSEAMLERARRYNEGAANAGVITLRLADLNDPAWTAGLPEEAFDWALAFAVFHHLPGRALRTRVLQEMGERVRAGGRVVMSNWQFGESERLRGRVVDWAEAGVMAEKVEGGDVLMRWERAGRRGLRYVHWLEEGEAREMAGEAGLRVVEVFRADGVSGGLGEYVVMERG